MLSILFSLALSQSKTKGYEEYKVSYEDPLNVKIPIGDEAIVLLPYNYYSFDLKVTSTNGSTKTHHISSVSGVRAFRVDGIEFEITHSYSTKFRVGVWLIPNHECYGAAIGLSGSPFNFSIKFPSDETPKNLCIFPMADENSFKANITYGSVNGLTNFVTDRYLNEKEPMEPTCINKICEHNMTIEDQWFIEYSRFSTISPKILNYEFENSQKYFTGCHYEVMITYSQASTEYTYDNYTSYSCDAPITPEVSNLLTWIIVGVVVAIIVIIIIVVLICCWPCIVACCCAAGAAAGAGAANSSINQPLQSNVQYPQQYPQQQYPPQQGYGYEVPK